MLCGTNGAVAAMDRAYMSLRAKKPQPTTTLSEQSSPFRRWTTGSGAGSSYRHHDHRNMYSKQMSEGSGPVGVGVGVGGGGGGVARWSLGLEQLLADPAGAAAFAHFLAKEFAAENIRFWWSCEQYRSCEEDKRRRSLAEDIWQRHLGNCAPEPVNVDAAARRAAELRLHQQPPPHDLFLQAQKQIFNVMKFDSYPRFLRSAVHAECARADLRGLPPPYPPTSTNTDQDNNTPTKLKKSASNASERRRSGGSLLPWKLRTSSRDRDSTQEEQPVITDVVKSMGGSGAALCRLALPDGASTVVDVGSNEPVQALVDRLLQRRNLRCNAYDVLLTDTKQGENRVVDVCSPSSVLGGRSAAVERRCVLRVNVAGRAVLVRCRPTRRLRHVLRPLLARYCGNTLRAAAVLRDSVPLHPDTRLQELDGARLQVVEVAEGTALELRDQRDGDSDSLTDLALRVQDDRDETQSVEYMTSSVSSCNTDVFSSCSTTSTLVNGSCSINMTSGSVGSAGSAGSVGSAGSAGSAGYSGSAANAGNANRVRAALRPGPPLHHHPPEFLENLRETQRQRLPTRTPPPLPPKPAHRPAPTVV